MHLNLTNNWLNGSLLVDIGRLPQLKSLDASGNQLIGDLLANITGLAVVSALVLRNNKIQEKNSFGDWKPQSIGDT